MERTCSDLMKLTPTCYQLMLFTLALSSQAVPSTSIILFPVKLIFIYLFLLIRLQTIIIDDQTMNATFLRTVSYSFLYQQHLTECKFEEHSVLKGPCKSR